MMSPDVHTWEAPTIKGFLEWGTHCLIDRDWRYDLVFVPIRGQSATAEAL